MAAFWLGHQPVIQHTCRLQDVWIQLASCGSGKAVSFLTEEAMIQQSRKENCSFMFPRENQYREVAGSNTGSKCASKQLGWRQWNGRKILTEVRVEQAGTGQEQLETEYQRILYVKASMAVLSSSCPASAFSKGSEYHDYCRASFTGSHKQRAGRYAVLRYILFTVTASCYVHQKPREIKLQPIGLFFPLSVGTAQMIWGISGL